MLNTKNIHKASIERLNRENFRVLMECMARPGSVGTLEPLFDSGILAAASTLLYQEVSWFSLCEDDFTDIALITGSAESSADEADYVFFKAPVPEALTMVKKGTHESPELGATLFFKCRELEVNKALLIGPGIDIEKSVSLPVDSEFADTFTSVNSQFPIGTDVFFIDSTNRVTALSRTTRLEIL